MEAVVATSLIDSNGCDGSDDGFNGGDDGIRRKRLSIKIALDLKNVNNTALLDFLFFFFSFF